MPPRSIPDWVLETLSALTLVASGAEIALRWNTLPTRIPTHFDAFGNPNGWGTKNSLLILLGATAVVAALLTAAETHQRLINIPVQIDRESPEVRRVLRSMVILMKAVLLAGFFWITDTTIRIATGTATSMGRAFLPLFLGAVFVPIICYTVKLKRF